MVDEYGDVFPQEATIELEAGDTYQDFAREFETSFEVLFSNNPNLNFEQVTPGQQLRVPLPPSFCRDGRVYIVKRGDTLRSISREFGVSEEAIRRANPLIIAFGLRPGLPICIPIQPPVRCVSGIYYTIAPGDTLFSIASRYRTTVEAILRVNPGLDTNRLVVGQRICIPTVEVPPSCPDGTIYTIAVGDTLANIATRNRTSVEAIIRANPGLDPNRLFVGQQICIPRGEIPPRCPGGTFYTIVLGDTLFSLALRYNTTVDAILRANPGLDPNRLFVGQQICIPASGLPTCRGGVFYTVVAGDTLNSIARKYNVRVEDIVRVNPGLDPNRIFIGQQICIPS